MNRVIRLLVALGVLAAAGVMRADDAATQPAGTTQLLDLQSSALRNAKATTQWTTPSGLTIEGLGGGHEAAEVGDIVAIQYIGMLADGKVFDSSFSRTPPDPLVFRIGSGAVIKGMDEGVVGMKVGDRRRIVIPPALGYGPDGSGDGTIPPNATLTFAIELTGLRKP